MFPSMQSQSRVTIKNLPALTETASPLDSAVMETTTAWIIPMRPVFIVDVVFERVFHHQVEMENLIFLRYSCTLFSLGKA